VPRTRRSRVVAAPPERIWEVVADPYHLPRWWPRIERVEAVGRRGWTEVMRTKKGRGVRADQRIEESEAPRARRWSQELEGTPFERLLDEAVTEVTLEPEQGGTRVTIERHRRLRGMARLGGFLFRSAARRELDEALDGLERISG
jgi:uncharacterized protein YndB with AHSA1/START domain